AVLWLGQSYWVCAAIVLSVILLAAAVYYRAELRLILKSWSALRRFISFAVTAQWRVNSIVSYGHQFYPAELHIRGRSTLTDEKKEAILRPYIDHALVLFGLYDKYCSRIILKDRNGLRVAEIIDNKVELDSGLAVAALPFNSEAAASLQLVINDIIRHEIIGHLEGNLDEAGAVTLSTDYFEEHFEELIEFLKEAKRIGLDLKYAGSCLRDILCSRLARITCSPVSANPKDNIRCAVDAVWDYPECFALLEDLISRLAGDKIPFCSVLGLGVPLVVESILRHSTIPKNSDLSSSGIAKIDLFVFERCLRSLERIARIYRKISAGFYGFQAR
ncbi:MAG: hypothetical protein NTY47_05435, partial [Candidatus Omnitrophica bacterium]|nr:hypothetical protein [Candidatus Omnitrophota bacterium]